MHTKIRTALVCVGAPSLFLVSAPTPRLHAQIHRVIDMNTEQLRSLDRAHTVVLLPGGILEEQGRICPLSPMAFATSS